MKAGFHEQLGCVLICPSIAAVLASLHRMGRVSWQDGRYALRLAA